MRRRQFLGLSLAGSLLALAGCGGSRKFKYQIAVIPKGLTHEFWQSIRRGADRAAADLQAEQGMAVEIIWDGPLKESDALAQTEIINRNVAKRVSGIVLAPQHRGQMVASVERTVAQGIPVLIIDSGLDNQDIIVKYVATDNYHGGQLAAEHLLRVLREAGKPAPNLILFRYQVGSESTEQRENGFENFINQRIDEQKKEGKGTITWLSKDKYALETKDTARREAQPLLNNLRDKGIDGIFAVNESSASGMLDALRGLGLNKKAKLVGFDSSAPLIEGLRDSDIEALILQDPFRMGYLGVWTLVQKLEGKDVGKASDFLSTGEYVLTRDLHDVAKKIYKLDSAEALALYDAGHQQKRESKQLRG